MRNRKNTMIIGDLNAKDRTWGCNSNNTRGKYLKEVIEKRANTQIIATTNATRIDPNGRDDILDIAIAIDMKSNIKMRTLKQLESDHLPVKITIKTNIDNTIISKMNKKEINWKNMRTELNKHEVIEYTNNTQIIEQNTEKIIKQIQNAVKASEKTTTITNKHKKLPIEIYYLIKEKRKLQRQFRETRHTQIKTKYNKINQEIKKKITEHSKEQWNKYIEKRLDEKDSHNFYIIPRQLKAKRNTIPTLEEGNNKAETDQEKAEMLAKKYEEIFTPNKLHIDITKEIDKFEKNFNNWCCVPNFNIIKPSDIKQDIKQLKKASAPGEYQITNTILKNLPHKTIVSITNIFNSTIAQSYYPQCLKTAIIVPIQKPGKNKKMTTSYRPINLLPTIGKLLDRRIQEEILNQIEIDDRQYGFRQGHSTTQQLFNITNTIASAFNKKETTAAIFLDLSNAFDKIDHRSLIHKLYQNGIQKHTTQLIKSYLNNRKFKVRIKDDTSTEKIMKGGVPQGSPLGPILYNIYINDLPKTNKAKTSQFADDTAIYSVSIDPTKAMNQAIEETEKIIQYYNKNGLKTNLEKTKAIIFTKKAKNNKKTEKFKEIKISNTTITLEKEIKYLGLTIDKKMTFTQNIKNRIKEHNKALWTLAPLLNSEATTIPNKIRLYNTYIKPHLTYDAQIWWATSNTNKQKIIQKYNRTIRRLTEHKPNDGTNNAEIRKKHNIQEIEEAIEKRTHKFYKTKTNHENETLKNTIHNGTIETQKYPTPLQTIHGTANKYDERKKERERIKEQGRRRPQPRGHSP